MREKTRRLLILSLIITVSIILIGCKAQVSDNAEKEIAVEVMEIKKQSISQKATLNTHLQPIENAVIIPKTPGLNVTNIEVSIGDEVSKGDFLFELDKTMVRKQIQQTKRAYDLARKNYDEQKKKFEDLDSQNPTDAIAAMYTNKVMPSLNIPDISQQDKESVLAASENQVDQARMAYSTALSQLDEMEYYSPISGYVSQININKNQPILGTQPALIITNMERLKASLNISKSVYEHLKEGQSVIVNIDNTEIPGTIRSLSPIPDFVNSLYSVEVEIDNKENNPWVGSFGSILIELTSKDEVIVIPKSAILHDSGEKYVFIEKDNRAYKRKVSLGIDNSSEVEVLGGLNEGEKIITKGHQFVKDKGLVMVVRGEDNENL